MKEQTAAVIRRDARGVPFINAANEAELYFAQGHATASDRLWQMDFLRRTARGELAEVFGAGAVEVDSLHRVYGFRRVAEDLWARASAHTREVVESYARGVNAYIEQCALPPEFQALSYQPRPWTAVDSIALGKLFAEKLSFTVDADILRALLSDLPRERVEQLLPQSSPLDLVEERYRSYETRSFSEEQRAILTEVLTAMRRARAAASGDSEAGSNSWVVSGSKTASGKPLLASDPHLPPTSPSIWHMVHLSTGDLRVAGVAVPGVPGVMIGHNQSIAWGVTNLCPDVQDLYFEEFEAGGADLYKTPAGWRAADVHAEEIAVRNLADGSQGEPVKIEVKVTRHGPVIFERGSTGLALRWTALDADVVDLDTFLALNRARNWDDFVTALRGYGGPPQTFTYADTAGHIGYYGAGRIPVRKSGDGSLPYDGTTDDGEWLGFISFDDLPHAFDPPSGTVVSANQRIVNNAYRFHLTHNWRVPYRARRIHELLQAKSKFDTDDFLNIQADTYSYPDAIFAAQVVKAGQPFKDSSTEWHELVEQLEGWDGYANEESTVLPLVTEMRKSFRNQILIAAIGIERAQLYEWRNEGTFIDRLITERPLEWLPEEFVSYDDLLLACYREAVDVLTDRLGSDREQWTWGRMAQVRFPHPLEKLGPLGQRFATRSLPQNADGSMPTVNAGARVSLRFIADLSDWNATRLCLPLGEAGDPASAHREDQLDEWYQVRPSLLPFSDAAIQTATRDVQPITSTKGSKMRRLEKLIFEQADKSPEAIAVEYNGARLSYRELKEQALEYSRQLRALGLTATQAVAILQERSLRTLPLMLGIWEAGGVVVPINPNTPPKMLASMLEDASPRIMVTNEGPAARVSESPNGNGMPAANQEDDCYVIYTSGSEGRPKGVVGTHRSLIQYLNWQVKEFAVKETDVFSQTAPLSFDFSLKELLVPLLCGARVCIAERSTVMDARKFVSWAQAARITIMCCVPALLRSILQLPPSPDGGALLPSLRALLISGDMLRWDDVNGCRERFGDDVALFNLYGPTESTVIKLFYPIPETRAVGSSNVPVGRPIDDADVLVVDENDRVCEAGETGQIVILSPWLARGYLHGERMAAQPFCTVEYNGQQRRAYRSGDVGRWLIDGNLELLGRKDRQVKIRGYRIELNEIESILSEHSGIKDVAVVTSNGLDQDGLTGISCYFTTEDPKLTAKDLRSFAKERLLPQVLSLTRFRRLDKLPLSPNGKVDRQNLETISETIEDETAASTNGDLQTVQQRISGMWEELLAVEGINPEANFFELGGDSMTAIRLLRRLREEIHPAVKLDDVYEFPSISQLSNRVEQLLA